MTFTPSAVACRIQRSPTSSSSSGHVDPTTLPLETFSITPTLLLQTLHEPFLLPPLTSLPWQTQLVRYLHLQLAGLHTVPAFVAMVAYVHV